MGNINYILRDLRHIKLFRRRYRAPHGTTQDEWRSSAVRYNDLIKAIDSSDYHWRVITYKDGRKELAYMRVLHGGLLSGMYPAVYRGIIIPHIVDYATFINIQSIRLAF